MNFVFGGILSLSILTGISNIPSPKIEYVAESQEILPPPKTPSTIAELIELYAVKYGNSKEGVPLKEIMPLICDAESECENKPNWKYTDESGHYTAYGIFMITRTTYREFCGSNVLERKIPEKNIECAMKIAHVSGLQHWNESKEGWD